MLRHIAHAHVQHKRRRRAQVLVGAESGHRIGDRREHPTVCRENKALQEIEFEPGEPGIEGVHIIPDIDGKGKRTRRRSSDEKKEQDIAEQGRHCAGNVSGEKPACRIAKGRGMQQRELPRTALPERAPYKADRQRAGERGKEVGHTHLKGVLKQVKWSRLLDRRYTHDHGQAKHNCSGECCRTSQQLFQIEAKHSYDRHLLATPVSASIRTSVGLGCPPFSG